MVFLYIHTYVDGNHSSMHSFLFAKKQGLTCHKEKLLCRVSELQLPSPLMEFLHVHYTHITLYTGPLVLLCMGSDG